MLLVLCQQPLDVRLASRLLRHLNLFPQLRKVALAGVALNTMNALLKGVVFRCDGLRQFH
jgi:hypothetical protein